MPIDLTKPPKFVQAKWYTEVEEAHPRDPRLIVIHSMEAPEKGETAENVARYFKNGSEGRKASAHYCIDNNSIVQCVQCKDVAYGAPNANKNGIHLEHAGYASQTGGDWKDEYSWAMLTNSARLAGKILCPKFNIPVRVLSLAEIRAAQTDKHIRGFCTHAMVTQAFNNAGGHMDPGNGFPLNDYMDLVLKAEQGII